jgi:hypothetical protein
MRYSLRTVFQLSSASIADSVVELPGLAIVVLDGSDNGDICRADEFVGSGSGCVVVGGVYVVGSCREGKMLSAYLEWR